MNKQFIKVDPVILNTKNNIKSANINNDVNLQDNPIFCLIIPTRKDREVFYNFAIKQIEKQTLQPKTIYTLDSSPFVNKIDITFKYKTGIEKAIKDGFKIMVFWEDDDWYDKDYLKFLLSSWQINNKPIIFGINETYYYHLRHNKVFHFKHPQRASAFNTLITSDAYKYIDWPPDTYPFLDLQLWKQLKGQTVSFPQNKIYSIGIKHGIGLVGGSGHNDNMWKNIEINKKFLIDNIDNDAYLFYRNIQINYLNNTNNIPKNINKKDEIKTKRFFIEEQIAIRNRKVLETEKINTNIDFNDINLNYLDEKKPLINILTRTANRPNYFYNLMKSVQNQTYKNYNHIISVDNDKTEEYVRFYGYIKNTTFIRTVLKKLELNFKIPKYHDPLKHKPLLHAPYNLHLNDLNDFVKDGWIMYLDDDDIFTSCDSLQNIALDINNINEDTLLLWRVKFLHANIPEAEYFGNEPIINHMSMIGFAFHSKYVSKIRFDEFKRGDYRFVRELWDIIPNKKWIDKVYTGIQRSKGSGGFGKKDDLEYIIIKKPVRTLFALTTYNEIEITEQAIKSIINNVSINYDLVIFDDYSKDNFLELEKKYKVKVITKNKGYGLTHSWNMAYKYFKQYGYDYLIIANNDILVPKYSIEELLKSVNKNVLAVPLTTKKGAGHNAEQDFKLYYNINLEENNYINYQLIQNNIINGTTSMKIVNKFNGFFFIMNKNIMKYELPDGNLFKPENINVGNEDDLNERLVKMNDKPVICLKSFIFHFKNITFKYKPGETHLRQNLDYFR